MSLAGAIDILLKVSRAELLVKVPCKGEKKLRLKCWRNETIDSNQGAGGRDRCSFKLRILIELLFAFLI